MFFQWGIIIISTHTVSLFHSFLPIHSQRDLPIGIMGSLLVCISLYIGVCLVLTGMVPFSLLSEDAPLAEAFSSKGMKFVSILISIGAVAGLTTTLLVGLYVQVNIYICTWIFLVVSLIQSLVLMLNKVSLMIFSTKQSRLYLGLGRDGLLPSFFSRIHPTLHTPLHSQIWCGIVAAVLAGIFNVHSLSHILSVGTLVRQGLNLFFLPFRFLDRHLSFSLILVFHCFRLGIQ